jgi:hypothetical protein
MTPLGVLSAADIVAVPVLDVKPPKASPSWPLWRQVSKPRA